SLLFTIIIYVLSFLYFDFFFFLMIHPPPISTLFPYTTLFRSNAMVILADRCCTRNVPPICPIGIHTPRTPTTVPRWVAGTWSGRDRKSTRLNSSHVKISYAVFCLKKKKKKNRQQTVHAKQDRK